MWIDIKEERPEIGQLCVVKDGCEIKINAVYLGYQITRAPLRNRHLFSADCITYDFPDEPLDRLLWQPYTKGMEIVV